MSPYAISLGILAITALDALCRFLRRFDVTRYECDDWGGARAVQWGVLRSHPVFPNPNYDRRYLFVRLPIFDYQPDRSYPPMLDGSWQRWCWMQSCVMYLGPLRGPYAHRSSWFAMFVQARGLSHA